MILECVISFNVSKCFLRKCTKIKCQILKDINMIYFYHTHVRVQGPSTERLHVATFDNDFNAYITLKQQYKLQDMSNIYHAASPHQQYLHEEATKWGKLFLCTTIVRHQTNTSMEEHKGNLVIQCLLSRFNYVLTIRLPLRLYLKRAIDHKINILLERTPPPTTPYKFNATQLAELKKQLIKLETSGLIHSSNSPYGVHVIFVAKKG